MDNIREPNAEETDRQPMVDLFTQVREAGLQERAITLSGLSPSTVGRILQRDPSVMYSTRVRLWKGGMVALDELREQRQQTTPAGSIPKPAMPTTEPECTIFNSLWTSVRTAPCDGQLHVYGQPERNLMNRVYGGSDDVDLRDVMLLGSVCPLNTTCRHLPDHLVERLARRTGIERNIWGDLLYDTSTVATG